MNGFKFILGFVLCLAYNSILSQPDNNLNNWSISAGYGLGKIQYLYEYTPVYILIAEADAIYYSPSWHFGIERNIKLSNRIGLSLGFSHITITEKSDRTAKPSWFHFSEKKLKQGFFHLVPLLSVELPDERFKYFTGFRLGTANFFGNSLARETSSSLGSLHADICLQNGCNISLFKPFILEILWIHGITKYNLLTFPGPPETIGFFKYHSFIVGIKYSFHI